MDVATEYHRRLRDSAPCRESTGRPRMMVALLLLLPAVWITWVLFRDHDSDDEKPRAITDLERHPGDREPRAGG